MADVSDAQQRNDAGREHFWLDDVNVCQVDGRRTIEARHLENTGFVEKRFSPQVANRNGLFIRDASRLCQDIPSSDGDVRASVHKAASQRTEHREDLRGWQSQLVTCVLDANLGFRNWGRLCEEAVFLKVVLPVPAGLGASDPKMRAAASGAFPCHNCIPKAPPQALLGK
jgi:hypothetical protein